MWLKEEEAVKSDKNWIQKAIKKPGSLRKSLGVKKGQTKVRNKMGYMKKVGRVKMKSGGVAKRGRGCEIR